MKRIIFSVIIGIVIGVVLGMLACTIFSSGINYQKSYGKWEVLYYFSSPLNVISTLAVSIIALFNNEIRAYFLSPKCNVEIVGGGFTENILSTANNEIIKAESYDCNLRIENVGSIVITDCELVVYKIKYSNDSGKKPKEKNLDTTLYWKNPKIKRVTLLHDDERIMPLIRILPGETYQDPSGESPREYKELIKFTGFDFHKNITKGTWEIEYRLQSKKTLLKKIILTVNWTGKWHNRLTEMRKELRVNLSVLDK